MILRQNPWLQVFISYHQQDQDITILKEIKEGLKLLQRNGSITIWYYDMLLAGQEVEYEIIKHLDSADIILLLLSRGYIDSDFLYDKEMRRAIERYENGEVKLIPVLLEPCDWQYTSLGKLQVLPKNRKPISEWKDRNTALKDVVDNIRMLVENTLTEQTSNQLLNLKAQLTAVYPNTMSQLDQEKELKKVEQELKDNFEQRISNEVKKRTGLLRSSSQVFTAITAFSLSCNLIGLFEWLIYKLPWQWLIGHPNSYSLQASFDTLLVLLVIGILYPNWRKWCWGGGAFAIFIVLIQILGGPPTK
jgi:hypothetical protein